MAVLMVMNVAPIGPVLAKMVATDQVLEHADPGSDTPDIEPDKWRNPDNRQKITEDEAQEIFDRTEGGKTQQAVANSRT